MTAGSFDYTSLLAPGLPAPAVKYTGFPKYNFVGGHNDAEQVPVDDLVAAATAVLTREGRTLATYGLESGPLGYRRLREFLVGQAQARRRHFLHRRRDPHHLRFPAGHRAHQRHPALARRHRAGRAGHLFRLAQPAQPARRQGDRHPARRRRPAHGCARRRARRPQAPRHPAQIHLHHPDGAEPDRHHHGRGAPPRAPRAVAAIQRADLRGRLLCRPHLGRPAPAGDLCHEQARRRHSYRLVLEIDRAGAAGRLHRRALGVAVAHAAAQDRRRLGRARADGARGILRAAFHRRTCRNSRARCAPSSRP